MKRRIWYRQAIEAHAGDHELPPGNDDEDPNARVVATENDPEMLRVRDITFVL